MTGPGLEDEGKVLLPEDDSGSVPANPFDVNINHHQIGALLVRAVLHRLQVDHRLWSCTDEHTGKLTFSAERKPTDQKLPEP